MNVKFTNLNPTRTPGVGHCRARLNCLIKNRSLKALVPWQRATGNAKNSWRPNGRKPFGYKLPILMVAVLMTCPPANATDFQPLDAIKTTAHEFIVNELKERAVDSEIDVGKLDKRLRLPKCEGAIEAFSPPGNRLVGRITVGVRCPGGHPWTVYLSMTIRIYETVVTAARPLAKGAILGPADIAMVRMEVSRLRGAYLVDRKQAIGKQTKRPLRANASITNNLLVSPPLVRRGERVTLLANVAHLEVRMEGKALMDGARGDLIRVKNVKSNRIVEGRVKDTGLITVRM